MAEKQQNVIVGVFVMMGIVVLGVLVMAFGGGRTLFAETYDIRVVFPQGVQGVQEGQTVTLGGKRVGVTRDLQFVDERNLEKGVVVIVSIEGFEIPQASEMVISPNLMGIGKPPIGIVVTDSADPKKIPRDGSGQITGRMIPMLDQLIPQETMLTLKDATHHIGQLAAALRPAAENLARLLEERAMQEVDTHSVTANFDTLIQRFDATLRSVNTVLGNPDNLRNFQEILANTRKISETGVEAMESARALTSDASQVARDVSALIGRLAKATDDLSAVLTRLDQTIALMQQKNGTIGRLMNDDRLYEELLLSARRLTRMLDDMREVLDIAKKGQLRIKAF